jgi:hypothetical protein
VLTDRSAKHATAKVDIRAFHDRGRYRKLFLTHLSDMASDFSLKWIASLNAPNGILDPAPFRLPMLSGRPMNYFG